MSEPSLSATASDTAAGATYKILRGFKVDMGYLEDEQLMNVPPQEKDTSLVQRNARNAS
jgi:hypothetical protein